MNGPLRVIFAVAILVMWVLFGLAWSQGSWTPLQWAMLGVAHVVCAIVFRNFVYVFSYGYAISLLLINLIVVATLPSVASALVGGCGMLYGLRLWHFLHTRQRDSSFKAVRARSDAIHEKTPIGAKAGVWIMVSWLMAFHPMTAYNVARAARVDACIVAGLRIAAGPWAKVAGIVAPLYVAFLMYCAARELDAKQAERYGSATEYRAYRDATGMLTPG